MVRYFSKKPIPVFFSLLIVITSFAAACIFFADAVFLVRGDGAEKLLCFVDSFLVQRIIRPFALVTAFDKATFTQELHVMGQRRLGHFKFL